MEDFKEIMMDKKLFEAVFKESAPSNMTQVTDAEDLKNLLDAGVTVEAKHTGPFGEDKGATVIGFGKIKDLSDKLNGVEDVASEEGYDEIEDWFADNEENIVIVLDQTIGQNSGNWYDLSGYNVSDLDLWVKESNVTKILVGNKGGGSGVVGTWGSNPLPNGYNGPCPNCGGEVFGYVKLPMNIMHGADYDICQKCGAMYPHSPWRKGEKHD